MAIDVAEFGLALRRHRVAAGLTQEELAERAGLSARGIQDLESGARRSPRQATVRRLAAALALVDTSPPPGLADAAERRMPPLPMALSSFVGREQEVVEIAALLRDCRLVTLTGAGGIGKTRLSLEVAAAVAPPHPGGVGLPRGAQRNVGCAELASLADGDLVVACVAAALGIREQPFRPLIETVCDVLAPESVLLLLDNCEHVLAACQTLVARLLRTCPTLRVLATSREPLRVSGEAVWRVPSLPLAEATRLFLVRAQSVNPGLAVGERGMRAVVSICKRLDGVPLAIELAAARTPMFTTVQIADRLDEAFRLLSSGSSSASPRHQTLRATVDWSYGLLSAPEKRLLERLSVFAGGWTFEACEAVAGDEDVLDLLGRLVDKSLVVAEPTEDGTVRYRLQEVLRQFSQEQLTTHAQLDCSQQRHAAYFLQLVEDAEQRGLTGDRRAWLDRLELEMDNFRAARRWFVARGDAEAAQRLCACLYRLLAYRSHGNEGRECLLEALALDGGSPATRAKALHFLGALAYMQADYPAAVQYAEESLVLRREIGDQTGLAWALGSLGIAAAMCADFRAADRFLAEARHVSQHLEDRYILALNLSLSAQAAYLHGDFLAARRHADESRALAESIGFASIESMALATLGYISYAEGDRQAAVVSLRAALATAEGLGEPYLIIRSTAALGLALDVAEEGNLERVRALLARSVSMARRLGNAHRVAQALEGVAAFAAERDQPVPALRLAAAASAIRSKIGAPLCPTERVLSQARLGPVAAALNPEVVAAAAAEGRSWSIEGAAAFALEFLNAIST